MSRLEELRFDVEIDGDTVPTLVWRTTDVAPRGTVLLGHGRTRHKRDDYALLMVERLVVAGLQVVAVDAPGHGERRSADQDDWPRPEIEQCVREWQGVVEHLRTALPEPLGPLAYWGLSMGTGTGLPLVAEWPVFEGAVLGLMHPNWPTPPGERIRAAAKALRCPVLFVANWDDTLAGREPVLELFDLLGADDKRLLAYPGEHGHLPVEMFDISAAFLTGRIAREAS